MLLVEAFFVSVRFSFRRTGKNLSPFRQKVLVMQRRFYLRRNKKYRTEAEIYLHLTGYFLTLFITHKQLHIAEIFTA